MRPPVVPWPVLAILLMLLLAAPVLAAGGSPGSGNSAGGEGAAGTGGQSSAMSGSSFSGVATVSGPATSGNQGGGDPDEGSPANSATDSSSNSFSGSPGISNGGDSQPQGGPDSGDGTNEAGSVGKSGQDPTENSPPSMPAASNGANSMETDSPGGTQQQSRESPADETNGAEMSSLDGGSGGSPEQRGTRVQARGGDEVPGQGNQAGSPGVTNQAGSPDRTNPDSVRGSDYPPGWSCARAGTLAAIPVPGSASTGTPVATGATLPPGTTGMRGRGQGAENRPALPPGHVPYGEVPYGHIPYGPNPVETAVSSVPSTSEDPRRVTRHRTGQQAAIEVAHEEPRSTTAFPLLFPPLLPLGYRRIFGKNVLANPSRKLIHDHICRHPGTDLNGITAACDMNRETVRYHIRQLIAYRKITSLSADGNTRYFQNHGLFSMRDQMVIHHLEKGTTGEILRYIASHQGATRQDLAEYLGIAGPTVSRHLATLAREGLVITKKEGKFLRCELGTDVILPGSMKRLEIPEPEQGTCTGS
jgi:DNA-binding transcriptional ArsR family regulator